MRSATINMNGLFLMEGEAVKFALGWVAVPPHEWRNTIYHWIHTGELKTNFD